MLNQSPRAHLRLVWPLCLAALTGCVDGPLAPSCDAEEGTLHGAVTLWAPPGEEDSEPAGLAQVSVESSAEEPILLYADEDGLYSIDLPAGAWTVQAEDASGYCILEQAEQAELAACQDLELNLVLTACIL